MKTYFFTKKDIIEIIKNTGAMGFEAGLSISKRDISVKHFHETKLSEDVVLDTICDVKLAYRIIDDVVIVEYAYLPTEIRNTGRFEKALVSLNKKYKRVLFEPSERWCLDNWFKPVYEIIEVTFSLDGGERSYLVFGTEKEVRVDTDKYKEAIEKVSSFHPNKKEVYTKSHLAAESGAVSFGVALNFNIAMVYKAIDEMDTRSGRKIA